MVSRALVCDWRVSSWTDDYGVWTSLEKRLFLDTIASASGEVRKLYKLFLLRLCLCASYHRPWTPGSSFVSLPICVPILGDPSVHTRGLQHSY